MEINEIVYILKKYFTLVDHIQQKHPILKYIYIMCKILLTFTLGIWLKIPCGLFFLRYY